MEDALQWLRPAQLCQQHGQVFALRHGRMEKRTTRSRLRTRTCRHSVLRPVLAKQAGSILAGRSYLRFLMRDVCLLLRLLHGSQLSSTLPGHMWCLHRYHWRSKSSGMQLCTIRVVLDHNACMSCYVPGPMRLVLQISSVCRHSADGKAVHAHHAR